LAISDKHYHTTKMAERILLLIWLFIGHVSCHSNFVIFHALTLLAGLLPQQCPKFTFGDWPTLN